MYDNYFLVGIARVYSICLEIKKQESLVPAFDIIDMLFLFFSDNNIYRSAR